MASMVPGRKSSFTEPVVGGHARLSGIEETVVEVQGSSNSSSFSSSSYCRKGKVRRGSGPDVSEMGVSGLASMAVCSLMCMRTKQSSNVPSFKIASGVRNRLNGTGQKVFICGVLREAI